jgi:hypothetical protein
VQIGNKVKAIVLDLQGNVLANGAEKIAPVRAAGGLNPRKDTHLGQKTVNEL